MKNLCLLLLAFCLPCQGQLAFKAQTQGVSGPSLLSGVAAFFPLDEPTGSTTGATHVDSVGGLQWLDKNNNLYGIRGVAGGAICDGGNSGANYLSVTNAIFDQGSGKSFTCTFWACGGNGGVIGEWDGGAAFDWYAQVSGGVAFSVFCNDLGGNLKQAITTNVTANPGANSRDFQFVAFGYDAAKQWWWASCNAAPMNPVTGVNGVRATGGRGFTCIPHFAVVDEVGYWQRALTQQELTNLYQGGFSDSYPFGKTPGTQVANQYGWEVTNLSGTISANTYAATKALADSFYNAGILGRFSVLMGMPNETTPGAFSSILCPVYTAGAGRGIEPGTRPPSSLHSFVNGDVSVNGITGNGSSKWAQVNYVNAGVVDLLYSTSPTCNSGAIIYCYTATSSSGVEFAAEDFFGTPQFDYQFRVNTTTFDGISRHTMGYWGYTNSIVFAGSANPGYYAIQRDSQSSLNLYFANSGNAHSSLMHDTTSITSCAQSRSGVFPLWAYYDGNICGGCNFSPNTLSFFGINYVALTQTDSANAYTAIQAYRTAIGGGFQ